LVTCSCNNKRIIDIPGAFNILQGDHFPAAFSQSAGTPPAAGLAPHKGLSIHRPVYCWTIARSSTSLAAASRTDAALFAGLDRLIADRLSENQVVRDIQPVRDGAAVFG
jgi:hypothetical protein